MSLVAFDTLPDEARLWCFAADRAPEPAETARLLDAMKEFLEAWTAHGADLAVGLDWRHHRFLLVAVDESAAGASGCSIDALVRRLGELEEELDLRLRDAAPVWYREPGGEGRIRCVPRPEFRALAGEGLVDARTTVFDLTVASVGELREGHWEVPAGRAWHARLLPAEAAGTERSPGGRP